MIESFSVSVDQAALDDLQRRLDQVRWPPAIEGSDWEDGVDADYLRALVGYWRTGYDWRAREASLNRLPHFRAEVDGTILHYVHARGQGRDPIPLLLLQGWPSSIVQMVGIIPLLTQDRGDGTPCFDVVAVSLPGHPLSETPTRHGMSFARIGELLYRLMTDTLGYPRFAGRGSDQGALVQQQIGLAHPDALIGLHRSGISPYASPMFDDLDEAERAYQAEVAPWVRREQLYAQLQSQRPETLSPALADSPVALASWFIEKFHRWGDHRGELDAWFGRDRLLDNISLHWLTGSGAASIRLYREWARDPGASGRVDVPTAFMMPLNDGAMVPAPRSWC